MLQRIETLKNLNTSDFASVILPLALPSVFSYRIPENLKNEITFGVRVEVQFGNGADLYAAIVVGFSDIVPEGNTKSILSVIDKTHIIAPIHFKFWNWIADYYMCTLGEVMSAALPSNLKLTSTTKIKYIAAHGVDLKILTNTEFVLVEALQLKNELNVEEVKLITNTKHIFPILNALVAWGIISIDEVITNKYTPRTILFVGWNARMTTEKDVFLAEAFEKTKKADVQTRLLLALLTHLKDKNRARVTEILESANANLAALRSLEEKGIVEIFLEQVSRIKSRIQNEADAQPLTNSQVSAVEDIKKKFETKNVVLLEGVTGSGKTRVYIELINEVLASGGNVLYLLPEINLTTSIILRLEKVFGNNIAVYHSRVNAQERVELWFKAFNGQRIFLGVRSSVLLPHQNLKLIIIDEEHDGSFKQTDPAPRYSARDAAIKLATLHNDAKVLLGTATPSVESRVNAMQNKFGWVRLNERFGGAALPVVQLIDLSKQKKGFKNGENNFTEESITALKKVIADKSQAIVFLNRRGFAPFLFCNVCKWSMKCRDCDVSLTYHKQTRSMTCHYCGYAARIPKECKSCHSTDLFMKGFGTERIETELAELFPEARIGRLDWDTAKTKAGFLKIWESFSAGEIDFLIGTQMVTKGLDFDNVSLVVVPDADAMLRLPNYKSNERAFQLLTQVAGRAGRRGAPSKILIQTFDVKNKTIQRFLNNEHDAFYNDEIIERSNVAHLYPPYSKLIFVQVRHKDQSVLQKAIDFFSFEIKNMLGEKRVMGPTVPNVARVKTYYVQQYIIRCENNAARLIEIKKALKSIADTTTKQKGFSQTRFAIEVDY